MIFTVCVRTIEGDRSYKLDILKGFQTFSHLDMDTAKSTDYLY